MNCHVCGAGLNAITADLPFKAGLEIVQYVAQTSVWR